MRKCRICFVQKQDLEFAYRNTQKTVLKTACKFCENEKARKNRIEKKEKWDAQKIRNKIKYREKMGLSDEDRYKNPRGVARLNYRGYMEMAGNKWKGHPCADKHGRILVHRLVMYNHIGRPLENKETIHHKNGDTTDNRIENLELWSTAHPPGQRLEDKVKWCIEFLEQYGYDVKKKV
jgi:hypothetical protein